MKKLLVALALAAAAAGVRAADTLGWHVVRPGETLQGITARYLGSPGAWKEVWKLNPQVKDPDVLVPGQRIRVILQRVLPARSALIRTVSRRVEKKPEPDPWQPAHPGDRLAERHGVQTWAESSAQLRFEDDSLLTLTEKSLVFLRSAKSVNATRDRSEIEIVDGQGDLEKPSKAKRRHDIEITVGTAVAKPQQGPARARFRSAEKKAAIMSYRGATAVSAAGASVAVPEGMGVSVPEGERPTRPERLLAAPSLAAVEAYEPRPRLRWPALKGAASYTVEICRDRACAEVVARAAGVTETGWTSSEPVDAGKLYWRVAARSATGLDGYPAVATLDVRLGISGRITADSIPVREAAVALYRDGSPAGKAKTAPDGTFVFRVPAAGDYTVAVDSRSIGQGAAWPEQVEGPSGALCGERRLSEPGRCAGGKSGSASDDAASLETAEHVARVTVRQAPVGNVDFGFSFNAVTNTADSGQGSLRQFLENANTMAGPNEMLFLPALPANDGTRWLVQAASPLPPLVDGGTVIDGRDRGESAAEPEEVGTVTTVGTDAVKLENPDGGSLSIDFGGSDVGIDARADAEVRNVSLRGARLHVRGGAALRVENTVVGSLLSRRDASGLELHGLTELRRVLVTALSGTALTTNPGARLEAEHLEVSDCAWGEGATAAVLLHSRQSRIRNSLFLLNTAAPAMLMSGPPDGIDDSTFRGNRIAIATRRDVVQVVRRVVLRDNIVTGIVADETVPAVSRIGVVDDGSMHVAGTAPGATRVEVLEWRGGILEPAAGTGVAADGSFDLELPAGR